jgi:hypothetical protein
MELNNFSSIIEENDVQQQQQQQLKTNQMPISISTQASNTSSRSHNRWDSLLKVKNTFSNLTKSMYFK